METIVESQQQSTTEEQPATCHFCGRKAVASVAGLGFCGWHIVMYWGELGRSVNIRKADHYPGSCVYCQNIGTVILSHNHRVLCDECWHVTDTMLEDNRWHEPIVYYDENDRLEVGGIYVLSERWGGAGGT